MQTPGRTLDNGLRTHRLGRCHVGRGNGWPVLLLAVAVCAGSQSEAQVSVTGVPFDDHSAYAVLGNFRNPFQATGYMSFTGTSTTLTFSTAGLTASQGYPLLVFLDGKSIPASNLPPGPELMMSNAWNFTVANCSVASTASNQRHRR